MPKSRSSKYQNKGCYLNGVHFSSKREKDWFLTLSLLQRQGMIRNLKRQVRFELVPKQVAPDKTKLRAIEYVADFTYDDDKGFHVVDVKPQFKDEEAERKYKKTAAYRTFFNKKKAVFYKYGFWIEEV